MDAVHWGMLACPHSHPRQTGPNWSLNIVGMANKEQRGMWCLRARMSWVRAKCCCLHTWGHREPPPTQNRPPQKGSLKSTVPSEVGWLQEEPEGRGLAVARLCCRSCVFRASNSVWSDEIHECHISCQSLSEHSPEGLGTGTELEMTFLPRAGGALPDKHAECQCPTWTQRL